MVGFSAVLLICALSAADRSYTFAYNLGAALGMVMGPWGIGFLFAVLFKVMSLFFKKQWEFVILLSLSVSVWTLLWIIKVIFFGIG